MFLQALGKPILVDGQEAVRDFQLNLPYPEHKLRLKAIFLNQSGTGPPEVPVDIVVFEYSDIKLDGLSLSIAIDGSELIQKIDFKVKLGYDFIRRKWRLTGTWNNRPADSTFSSIVEILGIIKTLASDSKFY